MLNFIMNHADAICIVGLTIVVLAGVARYRLDNRE